MHWRSLGLCALAWASAQAHALEHELSWGGSYVEGTYGRDTLTRVVQSPFVYALRSPPWRLKFTATWLEVHGTRADTSLYAIKHARGWGDAYALMEYSYSPGTRWWVTLAAQLKLPLSAYPRGLSTGQVDGGPQLGVYYGVTANVSLFGQSAYWWRRDPPALALRDRAHYILGAYWRATPRIALGMTAEHLEAAVSAGMAQRTTAVFLPVRMGAQWGAIPYVIKGYNSSSPAWGAGLEVQFKFTRPAV